MTEAPLRIGFIGLGFMGHGMATNIVAQGYPLRVMAHRRRAAVDDLVARGAVEVTSPAQLAAQCELIILCVSGAAQVDDLVRGSDGLSVGARPGLIVIDCTTSAADTILRLQRDFPDLVFVDAPLGRSPQEAWKADLSVMVGCDAQTFARVRPVLASFASTIQHVGALGTGHTLKLVNNFVSLGYAAIYSEALTLAVKSGLTTNHFDELIRASRMDCAFFRTFMGWVLDGNAQSHQFSLANAAHSVGDIVALSRREGLRAELIGAIASVYQHAVDRGMGDANLPELPRAAAAEVGLALRPAGGEPA